MATGSIYEVEDRGEITVLKIHPLERGLALADPHHMDRLWSILHDVALRKQKVLLISYPRDSLSPERTEEAWQSIMASAGPKGQLPPPLVAIKANLVKLIDYFRRSRTLIIGAFEGSVDLDLFGVLAICHYRICTTDTTFENKIIDRAAPPGSATIWFLTRAVGFAQAHEILLDAISLTANEAREMKMVNAAVAPDDLQSFALQKAEHFASKSRVALSTLAVAINNSYQSLPEFLDQVGTGFEAIYRDE